MDTTTVITITGRDVASKINVVGEEVPFTGEANEGRFYHRARCNGRGFIVTPEFYAAWKSGDIGEVNLSEASYEVDDPMSPDGPKIRRDSYRLEAWATHDQLAKIISNGLKIKKAETIGQLEIDIEVGKMEADAFGKIKISDSMMAQLKAAL